MEKTDFKRLKLSHGKKRNDFFANPIIYFVQCLIFYSVRIVFLFINKILLEFLIDFKSIKKF